jgi:hypothetical protein
MRETACLKSSGTSPNPMATLEERFWSKVRKTDQCWLWTAGKHVFGYGRIRVLHDGKWSMVEAHRVAWEIANGRVPEGLWVLHSCDTPACVRPDHLFLGSQTDNMRDAVMKGRHSLGSPGVSRNRGTANPSARLSYEKAREIRARFETGESSDQLAVDFKVSAGHIRSILAGLKWQERVNWKAEWKLGRTDNPLPTNEVPEF